MKNIIQTANIIKKYFVRLQSMDGHTFECVVESGNMDSAEILALNKVEELYGYEHQYQVIYASSSIPRSHQPSNI